jgi:hypothetical protein
LPFHSATTSAAAYCHCPRHGREVVPVPLVAVDEEQRPDARPPAAHVRWRGPGFTAAACGRVSGEVDGAGDVKMGTS